MEHPVYTTIHSYVGWCPLSRGDLQVSFYLRARVIPRERSKQTTPVQHRDTKMSQSDIRKKRRDGNGGKKSMISRKKGISERNMAVARERDVIVTKRELSSTESLPIMLPSIRITRTFHKFNLHSRHGLIYTDIRADDAASRE